MGDLNFLLILPVVCLTSYALLAMLRVPLLRGSTRMLGIVALVGLGVTGATVQSQPQDEV